MRMRVIIKWSGKVKRERGNELREWNGMVR